jgi:impB/mucB/samB family
MFGAIYAAEGSSPEALLAVALEFSPRVDAGNHDREIVLDLHGLTRLFGDARTIAEELRRTAADRGLQIRVAIAGTRTAARLMVRYRAGITVIEPGSEAEALATLPLAFLDEIANDVNSQLATPPPSRSEIQARFGETSPELVTRARQAAAGNAQPPNSQRPKQR